MTYARQLLEAHGAMAVAEAAQKACSCEEKGQTEEAEIGDISKVSLSKCGDRA